MQSIDIIKANVPPKSAKILGPVFTRAQYPFPTDW